MRAPRSSCLAAFVLVACSAAPRDAVQLEGTGEISSESHGSVGASTTDADASSSSSTTSSGDESSGGGDESSTGTIITNPAPGEWITITPGTFAMGAQPEDPCPMSSGNDVPHEVTLTRAFEIAATEVTFAQYEATMGAAHPHPTGCDDCPVHMVTWHDAAAVCNAYSEFAELPSCYACAADGMGVTKCEVIGTAYACEGYRLPTEAEWEYAARAGTTDVVHAGEIEICSTADPLLDTIAWYLYDAGGSTHPVATKLPNPWGLFDTAGNVWEWTHDAYVQDLSTLATVDPVMDASADAVRVMRGGSYNCLPGEVRAAHRSGLPDLISGLNVGLRCARTL